MVFCYQIPDSSMLRWNPRGRGSTHSLLSPSVTAGGCFGTKKSHLAHQGRWNGLWETWTNIFVLPSAQEIILRSIQGRARAGRAVVLWAHWKQDIGRELLGMPRKWILRVLLMKDMLHFPFAQIYGFLFPLGNLCHVAMFCTVIPDARAWCLGRN